MVRPLDSRSRLDRGRHAPQRRQNPAFRAEFGSEGSDSFTGVAASPYDPHDCYNPYNRTGSVVAPLPIILYLIILRTFSRRIHLQDVQVSRAFSAEYPLPRTESTRSKMLTLQRKFQGSRWYRAAMLFALAVTGGTGFAQQQSYVDPPGQVLFASDETPVAIEFDSLLRRLEETEHRLRLLEARQGSMSGESSESGWDLHSASLQPSTTEAEQTSPEPPKEKKWFDKFSLRGYAQFRYNYVTNTDEGIPNYAGDSSIGPDNEFLIRRARLIFTGNISDHLRVYLQPDFASTPDGAAGNIEFCQIRDWYGDVFLDKEQVHRFRIGQSKVPYGWENLQSSQNRLYLDRNDAFNSATRNERDLGVFYYWTPEWATDLFKILVDEGLKGSGNYGLFGIGVHNGQGGSLREVNDNLHVVSRLTWPWVTNAGQVYEAGIQGYTGQYVVRGSAIRPLGVGASIYPGGHHRPDELPRHRPRRHRRQAARPDVHQVSATVRLSGRVDVRRRPGASTRPRTPSRRARCKGVTWGRTTSSIPIAGARSFPSPAISTSRGATNPLTTPPTA